MSADEAQAAAAKRIEETRQKLAAAPSMTEAVVREWLRAAERERIEHPREG